jgi:hypothetical protein
MIPTGVSASATVASIPGSLPGCRRTLGSAVAIWAAQRAPRIGRLRL